MNLNITANKNFSIFLSKFQFLQLLNFFLSSTLTPESYLQHAQKLNYSFHFLTSYSPSTQFLAFRLIWGFWKWSQMIPHAQKPVVWYQNHVQKQNYTFGETWNILKMPDILKKWCCITCIPSWFPMEIGTLEHVFLKIFYWILIWYHF